LYRLLLVFIALGLSISACNHDVAPSAADGTSESVTAVYDCVARERPFSLVTQSTPSALTLIIPEPFVPRTLQLQRVEAASGERYEDDDILAWLKGDEARFIVDTVRITECDLNRQESIWQAAKLDGVDFRAVGNEPGWVLEIRERNKLTFRYDSDPSAIEAIATDIAKSQDTRQSVFSATSDAGNLRITLSGKVCRDTEDGEPYRTSVLIELDDVNLVGCGRALH
jgi:membrane-bound inhibitor of C-type lysozyme